MKKIEYIRDTRIHCIEDSCYPDVNYNKLDKEDHPFFKRISKLKDRNLISDYIWCKLQTLSVNDVEKIYLDVYKSEKNISFRKSLCSEFMDILLCNNKISISQKFTSLIFGFNQYNKGAIRLWFYPTRSSIFNIFSGKNYISRERAIEKICLQNCVNYVNFIDAIIKS